MHIRGQTRKQILVTPPAEILQITFGIISQKQQVLRQIGDGGKVVDINISTFGKEILVISKSTVYYRNGFVLQSSVEFFGNVVLAKTVFEREVEVVLGDFGIAFGLARARTFRVVEAISE